MDNTLKIKLDEAEKLIVETYELALLYGDDDAKNSTAYQNIFEKLVEIRNQAERCDQALEKAKDHSTIEDLENAYTSELRKVKKFDAKKTNEYKAFQSHLKEIKDTFDNQSNEAGTSQTCVQNDDMVMETEIQVLDPMTKKKMKNPVKNKICGHNYEKSVILQVIKTQSRLRCPVAGCGNNEFVKVNHLVDNDVLRVYIINMDDVGSDEDGDPLTM